MRVDRNELKTMKKKRWNCLYTADNCRNCVRLIWRSQTTIFHLTTRTLKHEHEVISVVYNWLWCTITVLSCKNVVVLYLRTRSTININFRLNLTSLWVRFKYRFLFFLNGIMLLVMVILFVNVMPRKRLGEYISQYRKMRVKGEIKMTHVHWMSDSSVYGKCILTRIHDKTNRVRLRVNGNPIITLFSLNNYADVW